MSWFRSSFHRPANIYQVSSDTVEGSVSKCWKRELGPGRSWAHQATTPDYTTLPQLTLQLEGHQRFHAGITPLPPTTQVLTENILCATQEAGCPQELCSRK